MRRCAWWIVALAALSQGVLAQAAPTVPPGVLETEARLVARASPQARAWATQEAARELSTDTVSQETAMKAAASYRSLGRGSSGDIEALAFIVLMEAAKSAQEDLKSIMANVKKINDAKASMRQRAPKPTGAAATRGTGAHAVVPAARTPLQPTQANVTPRPLPKAEFDRRFVLARDDLDAMSEMGELESLRLQMAMDRMSKMMSTLSNLSKKVSETASGITQNIK